MKNIALKVVAAAAVILSTTSCVIRVNTNKLKDKINGEGKLVIHANGPVEEKTVSLQAFNALSVESSIDVEFFYSDEPKAVIKASKELLDYVEVNQTGENLQIRYSKDVRVNIGNSVTRVEVYSPVITKVAVLGSGDFSADRIAQDTVDFLVSGSGDIAIKELVADESNLVVTGSGDIDAWDIKVGALSLHVVGSGDIRVSGKAESLDCGVVGSGDIDISGLECNQQSSNVKGSGSIIR